MSTIAVLSAPRAVTIGRIDVQSTGQIVWVAGATGQSDSTARNDSAFPTDA